MRKNNHGRRALSLLLSLMLVVSTVTGMTVHADTSEDGVYEYSVLEDGTIEITDYYGSEDNLVIPSEIDGYTVTRIGYDTFYNEDFTSISIPGTVTEIGPYAFQSCSYLTSIVIPDSVIKIEYQAFEDCYELSEITLPEHEMEIAPDAFDDTAYYNNAANWRDGSLYIGNHKICSPYEYEILNNGTIEITDYYGSQDNLVIPSKIDGYAVTRIGSSAFSGGHFTDVSIPDTVTEIGPYAFQSCDITSVVIPDSVIKIEYQAFEYCSDLLEITLPEHEMEIAPDAFNDTGYFKDAANWRDGSLYIGNHKICGLYKYDVLDNESIEITDYYGLETNVVIPSKIDGYTVTKIGQEAFSESGITSVSIPDTVTEIGPYAFQYCHNLTNAVIPNSIVVIGKRAFGGCSELSNIELPQHEIEIAPDAFDRTDDYYNEENWVDGWFYIGTHKIRYAFDYNILENGTAQITDYHSRQKNVVIPSEIDGYSVTEIGSQAFYISSIESVVVPDGVVRIGESAFRGCNLTEIILPEHEMEISPDAFDSTDYYENPENWKNDWLMIGNHKIVYAFEYEILENGTASITGFNSPQQEVIIPSEIDGYLITEIGNGAFSWNDSIISVVIPESVTSISASAFYDCNSLTQVSSPEHQMTVASNAFQYTPYINDIRNWENHWLMIAGNKAISAFDYSIREDDTIAIDEYISPEQDVIIPSEINGYPVTTINAYAFYSASISNVSVPDSVTKIGVSAFYGSDLQSIELPEGDITIGKGAFMETKYSNQLENWKGDYLYIGNHEAGYAYDYDLLENGTISITDYYHPNTEVIVPSEINGYVVSEIGGFSYNKTIEKVVIPASVNTIGYHAFYECESLADITIMGTEVSIHNTAFRETAYAEDRNNWIENELYIGSYKVMDAYGYHIGEDGTANLYEYLKPEKEFTLPSEIDGYKITSISGGYIGPGGGTVGGPFANSVENIVIPANIISASGYHGSAFYGNTSLKSITVTEDNPVYSSKDGVMFNKDQTELLQYPSQNERTNYIIPNTVTSIAYGSFSCASSLKSITIPASVNSINSTCLDYSQVTTIYGEPGSYAEEFAQDEGLTFIPIGQEVAPNPDSDIKVTEREDGILLSNVLPGSTVSEITAELMPGSYVIADKNGKVLDDTDTIGTGTTISVYAGDQIVSQATVVILGDTTGDGIINVMDLSQIQNYVLGLQQMDEVSAAAVQFGKDTVGVSSLLTVNAHVLNLQLIDQGMELS